jgi:type II secretion system protein N
MTKNLIRYLGYSAFFLFSFVVGIYLSFPWEVAKDRILDLVSKNAGMDISAASLEPNWVTGVVAKGVQIKQRDGAPIKIEKLKARVGVLALVRGKTSVSAQIPIGKGEIEGDVFVDDSKIDVDGKLDKIELEQVPLLGEMLGVPASGSVTLAVKMLLSKKEPRQTEGDLTLKTKGLKIEKGAKVAGFPMPSTIELGDIELAVPVKEGKATLKSAHLKGTDLELLLDGTVSLVYPLSRGTINLNLGVKPTEKLLNSDPLLKPLLKNFDNNKNAEGFYGLTLNGALNHPRTMPHRI